MLRQPIVVVLGQVDAGKTSLLDKIRSTKVQQREAGAITQAIGSSEIPTEVINALCKDSLDKMKINLAIPGLLFIDTPGHEAFSNLRQRGGSIADIAVLVVDLAKGIEPQTIESLEILKKNKTPFIIAANKVDAIDGFQTNKEQVSSIAQSLTIQSKSTLNFLDQQVYSLVGQLYEKGFSAERFDRVYDFTKQIIIVPVSARSGQGVPEVLMYLAGLAQKFLEGRLQAHESEEGKGKILEIREEKGIGKVIDAVLYSGSVNANDQIIFATSTGPIQSKIKALLRPKSMDEMRDPQEKFIRAQLVLPAAGIRIACDSADLALAGSSLYVIRNESTKTLAIEQINSEIKSAIFSAENQGLIVKADALGSLEAILEILADANISVRSAGVGNPSRKEVLEAFSVKEQDRFLGAILAFNVTIADDVQELADSSNVKIFSSQIIYTLLESYTRWVESTKSDEKKQAFSNLITPSKFILLKDHCFRASKPLVVGVEILEGTLKSGADILDANGNKIGQLKQIQKDKQAVQSAKKGEQVALSIEGPVFARTVNYLDVLFVDVPKEDQLELEGKYSQALSEEEKQLLKEIKKIKGLRVF